MLFRTDNQNDVARANDLQAQMWPDIILADDLDGGVRRMRWRGEQWLPRFGGEESDQYSFRLKLSSLYAGLTDALDRACSKPFSKKVTIKDEPVAFTPWLVNIDAKGGDVTQFARQWLRAAIKHGQSHVLVDYTALDPSAPNTLANEKAQSPRAFFTMIEQSNVLDWRESTLPDGTLGLAEIRYRDIRMIAGRKREFIRVIRLKEWEDWQNEAYDPPPANLNDNGRSEFYDWKEDRLANFKKVASGSFGPEGGFKSLPIVTLYTNARGFMQARPAFSDLQETNLTHWQSASDQRNIVHYCRVPILFGVGLDDQKSLTLGAGTAINTANPEARLQFVEHSGSAAQTGADDLKQLEESMMALGVRPLIARTGDVTATGVAAAEAGAASDVHVWCRALESGLKACFMRAAEWAGLPAEVIERMTLDVFSDFKVDVTGNEDQDKLLAACVAGKVSDETYLNESKRRGFFADDFDVEAELGRIKEAQKAKAEEEAVKLEAQMEMNGEQTGGMPMRAPMMAGKGGKPNQREAEE